MKVLPNILSANNYATSNSIRGNTEMDIDIIFEVTRQMKNGAQNKHVDFPTFVFSVYENRRLWSALAASASGTDNHLSPDLRAGLFYLYEYVNHYSRKVINDNATVQPLLDINLAVLRGLRSNGSTS